MICDLVQLHVGVRCLKIVNVGENVLVFVATDAFVRVFQLLVDESRTTLTTRLSGDLLCFEPFASPQCTDCVTSRAVRGFSFGEVGTEPLLTVFGHRHVAIFHLQHVRDASSATSHALLFRLHDGSLIEIRLRSSCIDIGNRWPFATDIRTVGELRALSSNCAGAAVELRSVLDAQSSTELVLLLCAAQNNTVSYFSVSSGQLLHSVCCRRNCLIFSASFAPRRRVRNVADSSSTLLLLASGTVFGSVIVWNAITGSVLHELNGHEGAVRCCAWSDARRDLLATCSDDRSVRVWRLPSSTSNDNAVCTTLYGHNAVVFACSFAADDSRTLYSCGGEDNMVRQWTFHDDDNDGDAKRQPSGKSMPGFVGSVWCIDTTTTMRNRVSVVVCGAEDGAVRTWSVDASRATSDLCSNIVADRTLLALRDDDKTRITVAHMYLRHDNDNDALPTLVLGTQTGTLLLFRSTSARAVFQAPVETVVADDIDRAAIASILLSPSSSSSSSSINIDTAASSSLLFVGLVSGRVVVFERFDDQLARQRVVSLVAHKSRVLFASAIDAATTAATLSRSARRRVLVTSAQGEPLRLWSLSDRALAAVAESTPIIDLLVRSSDSAKSSKFGALCVFCVALHASQNVLACGDSHGSIWLFSMQFSSSSSASTSPSSSSSTTLADILATRYGVNGFCVRNVHADCRVVDVAFDYASESNGIVVRSVGRDGCVVSTRITASSSSSSSSSSSASNVAGDDEVLVAHDVGRADAFIGATLPPRIERLLAPSLATVLYGKSMILADLRLKIQVHLCMSCYRESHLLCCVLFPIVGVARWVEFPDALSR